MAGASGMGEHATDSPAVGWKKVWAGANLSSYEETSAAHKELAGLEISAQRIRRAAAWIGQEWLRSARRRRQDRNRWPH